MRFLRQQKAIWGHLAAAVMLLHVLFSGAAAFAHTAVAKADRAGVSNALTVFDEVLGWMVVCQPSAPLKIAPGPNKSGSQEHRPNEHGPRDACALQCAALVTMPVAASAAAMTIAPLWQRALETIISTDDANTTERFSGSSRNRGPPAHA